MKKYNLKEGTSQNFNSNPTFENLKFRLNHDSFDMATHRLNESVTQADCTYVDNVNPVLKTSTYPVDNYSQHSYCKLMEQTDHQHNEKLTIYGLLQQFTADASATC